MAGVQKPKPKSKTALDAIDHVAISVDDIETAVRWYTQMFACDVLYQDDTWAYLKFANILLALVVPQQHRSHIALAIDDVEKHGPMKTHRDGTKSVYIKDPSGNAVELMDKNSMTKKHDPSVKA
jgi:catechol 2,3-dioxygenase-like lactoylglutathione lyase family enzyme